MAFEGQQLSQQIIYRSKWNLTENRIHSEYLKNILISLFYERFLLFFKEDNTEMVGNVKLAEKELHLGEKCMILVYLGFNDDKDLW